MPAIVGYARTSSFEQQAGLADQVAELKRMGATKIFEEQVSGVDADRPKLKEALAWCRDHDGDVFIVTKPCRLGRSTTDLHRIVADLENRGVAVRILSMKVDTTTATGKLIFDLLVSVAAFERALMLERQRAGIRAAKEAGRYKGRAPTALRKAGEVRRLKAEGVKPVDIAKATGISRASVYRILDSEPA